MESEKADEIPKWLKKLQEQSWELELLISGGAIFSLYQFSDIYINWILDFRMTAHLAGIGVLMMIGMFGIKVLTAGFTLHLTFRAYWLSLVCINYVYPKGIIVDKLKFRKPFSIKPNSKTEIRSHIISIDKLCGTVIYFSIISAFSILGLVFTFIVLAGSGIYIESITDLVLFEVIFSTILISFLVYIIDFLSFGLLRKTPILSYVIFPLFKLFDILSFRHVIQKSLRVFNTNVQKLKFVFYALLFSAFSLMLAYRALQRVMHWPNLFDQREYRWEMADDYFTSDGNYLDKWNEKIHSRRVAIGSQVVKSNLLEVFVLYSRGYDNLIRLSSDIDSLRRFSNIIEVRIDSQNVKNIRWIPTRRGNDYIYGLTALIPIESYGNGHHLIDVRVKLKTDSEIEMLEKGGYESNIHFWIDRIKKSPLPINDRLQTKIED